MRCDTRDGEALVGTWCMRHEERRAGPEFDFWEATAPCELQVGKSIRLVHREADEVDRVDSSLYLMLKRDLE